MIYLDYNASTPVDEAVYEAMLPFLRRMHGNPSSSHALGRPLREAIEKARGQTASLIGARPDEIVFTASGTEANNHVIKGVAHALRKRGNHMITSKIEHPAVTNPCHFLESVGCEVSYVGVDSTGRVDPQEVAGEVRGTTVLISIMHANNEVGTIQNIAEIAAVAHEGGVLMHTDAAQSCGKIATDVHELGVDFLSMAGHKLYAPQGIGALYIRDGISLEPLLHGAGHQKGRRAGTEPTALIVGLGAACEMAKRPPAPPLQGGGASGDARMVALRDRLFEGLKRRLGDRVVLLGHPTARLPNTLCVGFRGRIGGEVLEACPEICASTGAACHSGRRERSATLAAMGVP
ncbi:MAG: cysteine desulfurase family protein, partial [Phycisphaerales bacterium]|nr:cysteine desulfurase family protein [Phycisphaerales bacterium]